MIVEIQLHVRDLFTLKADLHVLYAGMRVLGATEDLMVKHEGVLTDADVTVTVDSIAFAGQTVALNGGVPESWQVD